MACRVSTLVYRCLLDLTTLVAAGGLSRKFSSKTTVGTVGSSSFTIQTTTTELLTRNPCNRTHVLLLLFSLMFKNRPSLFLEVTIKHAIHRRKINGRSSMLKFRSMELAPSTCLHPPPLSIFFLCVEVEICLEFFSLSCSVG
jgi:hypothetical protein